MSHKGSIADLLCKISRFIYPARCLQCNSQIEKYNSLCNDCSTSLIYNKGLICECCSVSNVSLQANKCELCRSYPPYFTALISTFIYNHAITRLLSVYKYKDCPNISRFLAAYLIQSYVDYKIEKYSIDLVIPIPLSYFKLLKRKFNQSALLAKYLAKHCGLQYNPDILYKSRTTKTQASLGLNERIQNVKNAYKVRKNKMQLIINQNILLVDDVVTTGNTVNQAAKALKEAGAKNVYVISLARVAGRLKIYYNI